MERETSVGAVPALDFTARRGEFAALLAVNGILTLASLGIYRFWARTRLRRFLWRHVRFLGDPLEYLGTPGELLLGFLMVLAVLFPFGALYGAIGVLAPPDAVALRVSLEAAYYLVLFVLIQIAFYRMWRYRMSRTLWRGVRFWLDGSSWQYLKLASGWTILTLVTLGLAYPWMKADLWRYQVQHTRLGSRAFDFDGDARKLLPAWLCVLTPVAGAMAAWIGASYMGDGVPGPAIRASDPATMLPGALVLIAILVLPFSYTVFRVRLTRFMIQGVRFGDAHMISGLRLGPILRSLLLTGIAILALTGPALWWLEAASRGILKGGGMDIGVVGALAAPLALLTATLILAMPLAIGAILGYDVARQLVTTTSVVNATAFESAVQSAGRQPAHGEGLADALDIGGL